MSACSVQLELACLSIVVNEVIVTSKFIDLGSPPFDKPRSYRMGRRLSCENAIDSTQPTLPSKLYDCAFFVSCFCDYTSIHFKALFLNSLRIVI